MPYQAGRAVISNAYIALLLFRASRIRMSDKAILRLGEQEFEFPIRVGTEGNRVIDISKLFAATGHITLDDAFGNTGAAVSEITYTDGEKGILRYRGYPIEEIAERANFAETAYLLIFGE